jgi:Fe-S-cluster containining protein
MINLTEVEYKSQKYKTQFDEFVEDFTEAELCGTNIIKQNEDGSCIYLKKGRCDIHDKRPNSCRNFFCDSREEGFKGMIEKIEEHKRIS